MSAPVVLVPGFWLGAWAWDAVAERLRADGHDVLALTLPGLDAVETDRSAITMTDHVAAIVAAIESFDHPVVLALHSGAAVPGFGATDRAADRIEAVVYIDSFPICGPINADLEGDEWPLPSWEALEQDGNSLVGLSDDMRAEIVARAVPEPAGAVRESVDAVGAAALAIPSMLLCTSFPSAEFAEMIEAGSPWMADLAALQHVTYVDFPTSHWPMWSATEFTAELLARVATERS
jgi:pimeloyl-ACP methyl ester carboxylesterase